MITLYLVCLIVGGALVAMSIFGGGDFDADADVAADVEFDSDASGTEAEGMEATASFLSLRNAVFFSAFFGLAGSLLTLLGIPVLLTAGFAVGSGLGSATGMHHVMNYLQSNESGEQADPAALEGALAEVVVGIDEDQKGKIAVKRGDRTLQLVAGVHQQAEIRRFQVGDEVIIVDLENGIARVAGTTFLA